MGVLEQNKSADAQLPRPAPEFAGHFKPLGGGPERRDLLQFRFKLHAAALFRFCFRGFCGLRAAGIRVVFVIHTGTSVTREVGQGLSNAGFGD
jgi:hypothetical protein